MNGPLSANRNGALDGAVRRRDLAGPARGLFVGYGLAVMLGGLAVLSGWEFGVERLKNLSPGTVSMKPNAAAAFVLCGLALLLCGSGSGRASRVRLAAITVFEGVAAAVGGLTLVEYATGTNLGIDQVLFHEPAHSVGTASPGRMALATGLGLVLSGCALACLARRKAVVEQALAAVVLLIALSGALGYLYGADLTRPWGSTQVSADTVAVLTILGLGLVIATPDAGLVAALLRNDPGGLMARWLLLAATIALPTLGMLRLAGQHAGLYDAGAGVGIMVLASLLVVLVTVGVTATKINALGRQRRLALEDLAASDRQLRKSLDHLLHVQENERRGLAIDLHDDALPALSAIGLQLELARERCQDPDVWERLSQAEAELRATRVRLRHLMLDLVPEALRQEGLGYVLRHRLEQMQGLSGLDYELIDGVGKQPSPHATAILYRIALEALHNVARHSDANRVRVELEQRDGRVQLTVADDGIGFRPSSPKPGHLGLSIMAERAELAGGGIQIDSQPGEGTAVLAWVPAGVVRFLETGSAPLLEEAAAHRPGHGGGSI
ncbi:MAG: ATP-binding protein [Solirubrobacteraceae bacterium]